MKGPEGVGVHIDTVERNLAEYRGIYMPASSPRPHYKTALSPLNWPATAQTCTCRIRPARQHLAHFGRPCHGADGPQCRGGIVDTRTRCSEEGWRGSFAHTTQQGHRNTLQLNLPHPIQG